MSLTLDPELLDEAVAVTGARSQREAVEIALLELVRRRRLARLADAAGRIPLTITREELLRERELE